MRRLLKPFEVFLQSQSAGGIALFITAVIAMIWANSPYAGLYDQLLNIHLTIGIGEWHLTEPVKLWINDGLMAIFFFVVGLEIKRELTTGELNSLQKSTLPVMGAIGGMLLPAAIFIFFNLGTENIRGWAIPMATDIAFAMGIISMFGSRIPKAAIVFLTALAIVDDIGAVIVIALFYTSGLNLYALVAGLLIIIVLLILNRVQVSTLYMYCFLGVFLWFAFFKSGVHPTVAGVLLGLMIPQRHRKPNQVSPLHKAEKFLLPWVNFFIMPVFALANAGVNIDLQLVKDVFTHPLSLGIFLGLFIGKQLGIGVLSWISVKLNISKMPRGSMWKHIYGTAIIGGIGFTMSIFITELALHDPYNLALAKLSIILGSLLSGLAGAVFILFVNKPLNEPQTTQ